MNEFALYVGYGFVAISSLTVLALLCWLVQRVLWKMMRRVYRNSGLLRAELGNAYQRDVQAKRLANRIGALGGLLYFDGHAQSDPHRALEHWRELQQCTQDVTKL
jgi:hypothetical protein